MEKYSSYKDSGIKWIGEIPSNWAIGRPKYNYYLKGRIGWQGLKADEFIDDGPYYLVTGTDFKDGKVNWESCYHISKERYEEAPEIHVELDDLLVTKDGTIGKVALIKEKPDFVSLNSHLLLMRPTNALFLNQFLFWIIQSPLFVNYYGETQNGSIMASLSQEKISNFSFPLPSPKEQIAIAAFLDNKVSHIDSIIAEAKASIEEYEQWKASIIYEAVTKGLDPSVDMKDSGVEWIGKMPVHWSLSRIKNETDNLDSLREPISAENRENKLGLYDYYGASGAIDKIDYYNVDDTVLLIGEDGANLRMRNLPLVYRASGKFWVNNHAHILKVHPSNNYGYMAYLLEAGDYTVYITGSAQPKLSQFNLMRFPIPIAPREEQDNIEMYLDSKVGSIEQLIIEKERLISDLESYKKSLIYEVVTGKRKVV